MKSKWDERYGKDEYYYGTTPNTFLVDHISAFKAGGRLLCLAEGEGRNAVYLAQQGFRVTAVDASQAGLDKLRKLAKDSDVQIEIICRDLNDFEIKKGAWDGIISIWCHLPSELRTKVHQSSRDGLIENGIFLLEAYTPDQIKFKTGGPQNPDLMPTLAKIEKDFEGFEVDFKSEMTRNISEGIGHQGQSAVVQFVGRKTSK
ncbi:class I SAM-dependent methyltransferase [soil metagenome]